MATRASTGTAAPAWEEARRRLKDALAREPELAARFRRSLRRDEPEHEILQRVRAGEFRG